MDIRFSSPEVVALFLAEVEMLFASNHKVLEPSTYGQLEQVARDGRTDVRMRAIELLCKAA